MKKSKRTLLMLIVLFFQCINGFAQVKIVSSSFSVFNVSAEMMCQLNLTSSVPADVLATIEARITNARGTTVLHVVTTPFKLKTGIYSTSETEMKVSSVRYSDGALAEFVRIHQQLPSGRYIYQVTVNMSDGSSDELSEEIESEASSFISLVSPPDKDTIEELNPLLLWTHSEAFALVQQGEFYRLLLTDIKFDQTAESAINVNVPLFKKDFLTQHDVLYPFDAPSLKAGNRYAWQVQKIINGVITNRTEAWEFTLNRHDIEREGQFVEILDQINNTPFPVYGGKLFFIFKDEYLATTSLKRVAVIDAKGRETLVDVMPYLSKNFNAEHENMIANDRFVIDLYDTKLKEGLYTVKVLNSKGKECQLKISYEYR